jgi:KDO2-lipid IV(A) lauroyltransferase
VVRQNLKIAFPNKKLAELIQIEKLFYRHFVDSFLESIKGLTMSKNSFRKRLHVENPEILESYYALGKSIILYSAHYGNWEWLLSLPLYDKHQLTTFYKPQKNSYFDSLMIHIRSRYGLICLESNKGYKSLMEFKRDNILTTTLMIGDQSPRRGRPAYTASFFNLDTDFLPGAVKIAQKANQVLLFPFYSKVKRGHYKVRFHLLEENPKENSPEEMVNKFSSILENQIKSEPELWLWSHKRWKNIEGIHYS